MNNYGVFFPNRQRIDDTEFLKDNSTWLSTDQYHIAGHVNNPWIVRGHEDQFVSPFQHEAPSTSFSTQTVKEQLDQDTQYFMSLAAQRLYEKKVVEDIRFLDFVMLKDVVSATLRQVYNEDVDHTMMKTIHNEQRQKQYEATTTTDLFASAKIIQHIVGKICYAYKSGIMYKQHIKAKKKEILQNTSRLSEFSTNDEQDDDSNHASLLSDQKKDFDFEKFFRRANGMSQQKRQRHRFDGFNNLQLKQALNTFHTSARFTNTSEQYLNRNDHANHPQQHQSPRNLKYQPNDFDSFHKTDHRLLQATNQEGIISSMGRSHIMTMLSQ